MSNAINPFDKTGIKWDKVEKEQVKVSEKKIEEMRSMINTKMDSWANKIQVSMTPRQSEIQRAEGEEWVDISGKKWRRENGINQTVGHMQHAVMPWWCPNCTKVMNHRFDRKFFFTKGWCYDCNIEFEGKLRLDGLYEKYEKCLIASNEKAILRDKIIEHTTYIKEFKVPTVYFEDGRFEVIAEKETFEPLFEKLLEDVDLMVERLEELAKEEFMSYDDVSLWMEEFRRKTKETRENK